MTKNPYSDDENIFRLPETTQTAQNAILTVFIELCTFQMAVSQLIEQYAVAKQQQSDRYSRRIERVIRWLLSPCLDLNYVNSG